MKIFTPHLLWITLCTNLIFQKIRREWRVDLSNCLFFRHPPHRARPTTNSHTGLSSLHSCIFLEINP
jgi:hypothetical protein